MESSKSYNFTFSILLRTSHVWHSSVLLLFGVSSGVQVYKVVSILQLLEIGVFLGVMNGSKDETSHLGS